MKQFWAKVLGFGVFGLAAIDASLNAHGIPKTPHDWLTVLGGAAAWIAIHKAASTDGTR